jgi:hypothetical protein
MTPNITSMRKEFTTTAYQQQSSYHHQQLLDHSTTATSPMKPKKRGSDSSKKPKKRRSSSASDKENDAQQQQQQQLQTTAETTSHAVTTNGYTNSNNTSDATSLANGTTTDSNSTHHSPSHNSSSLPASSTSSASTSQQPQTPAVSVAAPTAVQTKVYDPHAMDFELEAAVELMTRFVSKTPAGKANLHKLGQFNTLLVQALREYYKGHWYPERPMRGSGHRCLRVNQSGSTSIIEKTGKKIAFLTSFAMFCFYVYMI